MKGWETTLLIGNTLAVWASLLVTLQSALAAAAKQKEAEETEPLVEEETCPICYRVLS